MATDGFETTEDDDNGRRIARRRTTDVVVATMRKKLSTLERILCQEQALFVFIQIVYVPSRGRPLSLTGTRNQSLT